MLSSKSNLTQRKNKLNEQKGKILHYVRRAFAGGKATQQIPYGSDSYVAAWTAPGVKRSHIYCGVSRHILELHEELNL